MLAISEFLGFFKEKFSGGIRKSVFMTKNIPIFAPGKQNLVRSDGNTKARMWRSHGATAETIGVLSSEIWDLDVWS